MHESFGDWRRVSVARSLISEFGADQVALVGDSAGGGAAIATMCALRDAGDPLPACAFVMSPWTDLTASGDTMQSHSDVDPMVAGALLGPCITKFLGATPPEDPRASPLFADLTGLPPTLVQVGSDEIVLDDSTRLVESAQQAGVSVELDVWPGMWLVFQGFVGFMPEENRAMRQGADFVVPSHAVDVMSSLSRFRDRVRFGGSRVRESGPVLVGPVAFGSSVVRSVSVAVSVSAVAVAMPVG